MKLYHLMYVACAFCVLGLFYALHLGNQKLHAERLHERTVCGDKGGELILKDFKQICAKVEILK